MRRALTVSAAALLLAMGAAAAVVESAGPMGQPYGRAVAGFIQGLPPQLSGAALAFLNSPAADPAALKGLLSAPAAAEPADPAKIAAFVAGTPSAPEEAVKKLRMLEIAFAPLVGGSRADALARLAEASGLAGATLTDAKRKRIDASMRRIAEELELSKTESDALAANGIPPDVRAARRLRKAPSKDGPAWIPGDPAEIAALDRRLADEEAAVLKTAEVGAARFFLQVRKEALDSKRPDGDFSYPIFEPVLKRIMLDLAVRTKENLSAGDRDALRRLLDDGQQLLQEGVPYKKTMRMVFRYLDALDGVFVRLHPELAASFHREHAEHVLEPTLGRSPDVLIYPSFRSVDVDYFVNTRAAPFHIVGLHPTGLRPGEPVPFADGFNMKPSEFAWHDIGHVEFMAMRDFEYLDGTFKPVERVVQEWDLTRRRLVAYWDSFKGDKNLHDAMSLILFEILHERGYQYSFAVLKAQLDTPKWTEILLRKRDNDYYRVFPEMNMALFPELENARRHLLRFVDESRRRDQKRHVAALFGDELAVRVTHFPKVRYGRGTLEGIRIDDSPEATVLIRDEGGALAAPEASGLILAQVNPAAATPFDPATRSRIDAALAAKKARRISRVLVLPDKQVLVEFANGSRAPLASVELPASAAPEAGKQRHFFELEQALGAYERGQPISFTIQDKPKVYIGTVRYGLVSGEEMLVVKDEKGAETSLPLSEVLVDPLQKGDFARPGR